jgi:hypothetical protein
MDIENNNIIKIHVPNTNFWVWGERIEINLWNLYLINPQTTYRELIRPNMTTKAFAIMTNMTLKTPFPYVG